MFGYSADEALGQSLDLIVPERFRARHWEGYRQVMATGVTSYFSVRNACRAASVFAGPALGMRSK